MPRSLHELIAAVHTLEMAGIDLATIAQQVTESAAVADNVAGFVVDRAALLELRTALQRWSAAGAALQQATAPEPDPTPPDDKQP